MGEHDEEHTGFFHKLKTCSFEKPWGHNEEGKFVLSRLTMKEWGQVLLAILLFYAAIAAIFTGMYFAALAIRGSTTSFAVPKTVFVCSTSPPADGC
mmetsp:Transcript_27818/g.28065  ORF Transcript_27818/g.28065 Transcript_27818/m.28065 type:complete len:96 (+) Transcript_27818:60-347(+)